MLSRVRGAVTEVTELEHGSVYHFPPDDVWILELANLIHLEHTCCPFLTFNLRVEPGRGSILLELTGPEGTKEFLASIFS